ncbi:(-)-kolavenyl diphosphate synthase TPS10 chloroplastic [Dissostichus eleginoides]|uniref:(-)-kolavenyl diphosphate synthase TPS10 chloroplastic n=1 Tax=Dissostichus eleginoides TaxID=100907 RepID=A0AAD9C5C3_DISEL|nr:(-)-kolavenyl diphosphate synthase TPS10 chloroplastic [Dissostichus eleginoides]
MGGIDQHHAEEVVPESLYLLLRLLCTDDDDQENMDKQTVNTKLLSIAQDIVFLASGGQRPTPKHIGIGVAVHQATRSKGLVQLLHAAGHSISYESVLRTDTAIANEAVKQYFDNGRVFIPQNFVNAKLPGYIMYANDNIDINEETLDGKGTFHASQTAAFR